MKFKMKFLFPLISFLFIGLVVQVQADGSVGDFSDGPVDQLDQADIEKYYTTKKVVGRDVSTDEECSATVLEGRKRYQESVSNSLPTMTSYLSKKKIVKVGDKFYILFFRATIRLAWYPVWD